MLTWCQLCGKENTANMFGVLQRIQQEKHDFQENFPHVTLYDVHDGKMI